MGAIPDREGCDGIKGKICAPGIGVIETAVLDAGALFEGMKEPLDMPAPFGPAEPGGGRIEVRRLGSGGDQHHPG